jgi:hypothetical protein
VENNPYAPPKAAVADVEPTVADGLVFFAANRTFSSDFENVVMQALLDPND